MNKLNQYRLFALLVPILCLAVGGWVVWNQKTRLENLTVEHERIKRNLDFQKEMIAAIGKEPLAEKEPTVFASDAEQAAFLEGLRAIATNTGVTLTKWNNVAAPTNPADKTSGKLPEGVTAMLSTLEVNGQYPNVRDFLYEIARAPRLLNFSGIRWARATDNKSTVLSVTITRYVSLGAPAAPVSSPAASTETAEKSS